MPTLVDISPEATAWVDRMKAAYADGSVFGRIRSAVIWTADTGEDGELLLDVDPMALAARVNAEPYPLWDGHDPGRPQGKVLAAEVFKTPTGETFVAAAIGFYDGAQKVGFADLGVDPLAPAPHPAQLPALPEDFGVILGADPRDVDKAWIEALAREAPFPVHFDKQSHNSADPAQVFIVAGVAFLGLVGGSFSHGFLGEAGKVSFTALHAWLKRLFERMAEQRQPILEIQSNQQDCVVSFMMRGNDVHRLYKAHNGLADAAVRAAQLISRLADHGTPAVRLLYEFDVAAELWFPAYAELADGRLVTDNANLIAAEQLPSQLSLGLSLKSLEPPQPED